MISPLTALRARRVSSGGGRDARRAGRHTNAPRVPFALLVTGLIVGALALLLTLNTASAANELQRHDFALADDAIAADLQDLRVEVAARSAPNALARAAAALGMVPAGNPAFVVIGPDGTATVMGRPGPVTAPPVYVPPATAAPKPKPTPKTAAPTSAAPKTAAPEATPTSGARASRTTGRSVRNTSRSPSSTPSSRPSSTPVPRPSRTPVPIITLPGGTR